MESQLRFEETNEKIRIPNNNRDGFLLFLKKKCCNTRFGEVGYGTDHRRNLCNSFFSIFWSHISLSHRNSRSQIERKKEAFIFIQRVKWKAFSWKMQCIWKEQMMACAPTFGCCPNVSLSPRIDTTFWRGTRSRRPHQCQMNPSPFSFWPWI